MFNNLIKRFSKKMSKLFLKQKAATEEFVNKCDFVKMGDIDIKIYRIGFFTQIQLLDLLECDFTLCSSPKTRFLATFLFNL